MARSFVPTVPEVTPAGPPGEYLRIPLVPEAFGSSIGTAEQKAGTDIERGASALFSGAEYKQNLFNQTVGDQQTNNYQDTADKLLHGDPNDPTKPGLLNMHGQDALDAGPKVRDQLLSMREQMRGTLQNDRQRLYFDSATRRLQSIMLGRMADHVDREYRTFGLDNSKAESDLGLRQIALDPANDQNYQVSLDRAINGAIKQQQIHNGMNLSPAIRDDTIARTTQAAVTARVHALAQSDPAAADKFLEDNKTSGNVPGQLYDQLKQHLNGKVRASNVAGAVADPWGWQNQSSNISVGGDEVGARVAKVWRNEYGWTDAAIQGGLNNGITESGLKEWNNPGAGGELGVFQFHPGSHLPVFQRSYGGDTSAEAQARYVAEWAKDHMPGYGQSGDARSATSRFFKEFERPKDQSDTALAARGGNTPRAQAVLAGIGSGGVQRGGQPYTPALAENRARVGAPAQGFDIAGGDSIGVGHIRYGGLGGTAVNSVTAANAADADAAGGRNPQQALNFINAHPERFQGKKVLWSSGLMNAGADPGAALSTVGQQLDALKAVGASVVLAGVDQGKFGAYNADLQKLASDRGIPFAGPLPTRDVHPGPQGYRDYSTAAARLLPPAGGGPDRVGSGAAPTPLAPQPIPPGTPTIPPSTNRDRLSDFAGINSNPRLTFQERELALTQLERKWRVEDYATEHQAKIAEQVQKRQQAASFADLYSKAIAGQPVDDAALSEMVKNQQITPTEYNSIRTELTRKDDGTDRAETVIDLASRAAAGENVTADIANARQKGELSKKTTETLINSNATRQREARNELERREHEALHIMMGRDAMGQPIVDIGKEHQAAAAALSAQAEREWAERVFVKRENPVDVLGDMAPRYARPITDTAAFPRPRVGTISKPEDVETVARATQTAHDAGQLTDQQFQDEQALILRYKAVLDAQRKQQEAAKAAQDAAKARPGGGARVRGVAPSQGQQ